MKLDIKPGKYIVAVSGGVDSMALLDILRLQSGLELIVAHYDHGIRPDSAEDRKLVQEAAERYGLPFAYEEGKMGPNASEAEARERRYAFLSKTKQQNAAGAIITAHHRDDMLETAIINMLRGTGRKGLSSLSSGDDVVRPLLEWTKEDILAYARKHKISWREDTTNADERYMRNYVRRRILPRFSQKDKQDLFEHINSSKQINKEIDDLLARDISLHGGGNALNRPWFIGLTYALSCEVLVAWLRQNGISGFDRPLIERLVVAAKTKQPGKVADVNARSAIKIGKDEIKLFKR